MGWEVGDSCETVIPPAGPVKRLEGDPLQVVGDTSHYHLDDCGRNPLLDVAVRFLLYLEGFKVEAFTRTSEKLDKN